MSCTPLTRANPILIPSTRPCAALARHGSLHINRCHDNMADCIVANRWATWSVFSLNSVTRTRLFWWMSMSTSVHLDTYHVFPENRRRSGRAFRSASQAQPSLSTNLRLHRSARKEGRMLIGLKKRCVSRFSYTPICVNDERGSTGTLNIFIIQVSQICFTDLVVFYPSHICFFISIEYSVPCSDVDMSRSRCPSYV